MTVTKARAALPEVLDRVVAGEEVTITRHGRAVAVVVRPDSLRSRRAETALAAADSISELLAAARRSPRPKRAALTATRAEELIADIRAGRDR